MPRIIPCTEHAEWHGVDAQRNLEWDGKQDKLVASATIDGVPRWLNCVTGCRWEMPPAVEQALGSVGNPSLARVWDNPSDAEAFDKPKRQKKEKNVAKTEPKKRDRTPKKSIVSRKFGPNIEVAVYLKGGTIEDVLALPEAERTALFDLLTGIKAETPKGV